MQIRKAGPLDIKAIRALFWDLDSGAIAWQPEHFQQGERDCAYMTGLIEDEMSDFLLAVAGDQVLGFSLLLQKKTADLSLLVPCSFAYIQDFVVREGYRGQGIGSALMDASKAWAKERGLSYLRLSVLPQNEGAQRFYARHGLHVQMISMEYPL